MDLSWNKANLVGDIGMRVIYRFTKASENYSGHGTTDYIQSSLSMYNSNTVAYIDYTLDGALCRSKYPDRFKEYTTIDKWEI